MSRLISPVKVFDREFLATRAKLIDLAASLDRIQRAGDSESGDSRPEKIRQAIQILAGDTPNRAEQIQILFSLPIDANK